MKNVIRSSVAAAVLAAVLATGAVAASGSAAKPKVVTGKVGPAFTIGLTLGGKKVTKLKAGTPYRFTIADRSSSHNFHLLGPGGFSRVFTSVAFVGTKTATLTLKKGTYHFQCDPHASFMNGTFVVA